MENIHRHDLYYMHLSLDKMLSSFFGYSAYCNNKYKFTQFDQRLRINFQDELDSKLRRELHDKLYTELEIEL